MCAFSPTFIRALRWIPCLPDCTDRLQFASLFHFACCLNWIVAGPCWLPARCLWMCASLPTSSRDVRSLSFLPSALCLLCCPVAPSTFLHGLQCYFLGRLRTGSFNKLMFCPCVPSTSPRGLGHGFLRRLYIVFLVVWFSLFPSAPLPDIYLPPLEFNLSLGIPLLPAANTLYNGSSL